MSLSGATYSFRKTLIASVFPGFDFIALYLTLSAGGRDEITPLYRNQLEPRSLPKNAQSSSRPVHIIPVLAATLAPCVEAQDSSAGERPAEGAGRCVRRLRCIHQLALLDRDKTWF